MATKGFRRAGHPPSLAAAPLHFDVSFVVWVLLGALGAAGFATGFLLLSVAVLGASVSVALKDRPWRTEGLAVELAAA